MYIGRIVAVAKTGDGRLCAMYRVSSRSFPNRMAVPMENRVSIVPKPGHESDVMKNPYIAYNCARIVAGGQVAVLGNGSQTDPIAEKIAMGAPVRDALVQVLLAMDYEKDSYNTPRITAICDARPDGGAWLGIVRHNGLQVEQVELNPGTFRYVATYEENHVSGSFSGEFPAICPCGACEFVLWGGLFAERTNPVTAVTAMYGESGYELAAQDVAAAS